MMPNIISKGINKLFGKDIPASPPMGEVASDSKTTQLYAGYMNNLLSNPDTVLNDNKENDNRLSIYQKMVQSDLKISSCIQTRKAGVAGNTWKIEPGSEEDSDAEIAMIIQYDILGKLNLHQDIKDMLDCLKFGYAPMEIIWGYDEDKKLQRPFDLRSRSPIYFGFESDTHNLLFKPEDSMDYVPVPDFKFIVARNDPEHDNPYGTSVLRDCYWYYWFKKLGIKWWAMAIERFAAPIRMMRYPKGVKNQAEIDKWDELNKSLDNFGSCITLPEDIKLELLQAVNQAKGNQKEFADYVDGLIAQRLIGQTLTSDIGSTGSFAASQTHEHIRQDIIEDDSIVVQNGINDLIEWVHLFNWGPPKYSFPTFNLNYEPEGDHKGKAEVYDIALNKLHIPLRKEQVYNDIGCEMPNAEDTPETIVEPAPRLSEMLGAQPPDPNSPAKRFAEDPAQLHQLVSYPKNQTIYQLGSIATIQERFRGKLNDLFDQIASDLPEILEKAHARYDQARAIMDDYLRDNYGDVLRGYVTQADKEVLRFAIYDMASKLERAMTDDVYDSLLRRFLSENFYRYGKTEIITQMKDTMVKDLLAQMDRLGGVDADLNTLVADMTDYWSGFVAPNKVKQIVLSETREAANWSVLEMGKQSDIPMIAWFYVDPASCAICQEVAMGNPYDLRTAQAMGLPHPGCNDQWIMTYRNENEQNIEGA